MASAARHAKAAQKGKPVSLLDWLGTPAHLRALAVAISNCRDDGLSPTRVFVVEAMARHSKSPCLTARACHGAQFGPWGKPFVHDEQTWCRFIGWIELIEVQETMVSHCSENRGNRK